ncbi:GNAT family N-acetyltransferase [Corynebacterium kozikiae]|uniref:GNAT family N-acetyltransferase n=1 Tax=Corynebacterium kozikiae TaxID=2968469 RepID=UPI00211CC4B4|nr:GNAT family N-acetyltransferase [Corynebacterium sp. 76QC2CO]
MTCPSSKEFTIVALSRVEFSTHVPTFVDIYVEAMGYQESFKRNAIESWRRAVLEQGFVGFCALVDSQPAGIAYGFLGRREHWWDQQLRRGIREQYGRERFTPDSPAQRILDNYLQLAEIHVSPAFQGLGLGRALLSAVEQRQGASAILLSTPEVPAESNRAFHLYRSFGYQDVLRNFLFTGDARPFAVLGKVV